MHETVMAQQIVRTVLAEMERQGAVGVRSVEVELGGLEPVRIEALRDAFALEAAGTPMESIDLRAMRGPATARCPQCARSWDLADVASEGHEAPTVGCLSCGSPASLSGSRGLRVRQATFVLGDG